MPRASWPRRAGILSTLGLLGCAAPTTARLHTTALLHTTAQLHTTALLHAAISLHATVQPAPAGSSAQSLRSVPLPAPAAPGDTPARAAPDPGAAPQGEAVGGNPHPIDGHARPATGPPSGMLPVPGGSFVMGTDTEGELDERPAHRVTVASFLLDETEVTNAAYLECVRAGRCAAYASLEGSPLVHGQPEVFHRPTHPVVGISWSDAKAYCEFRGKRLPTEAEWERAARGDDQRRYVWGNEAADPTKHGVFQGRPTTAPVGSFPLGRGAYGHLDLAGNVWEWLADEYDPYAYQRPGAAEGHPGSCAEILTAQDELRRQGRQGFTGSNPIPTECEHVLRGGAYNYAAEKLRNSNRVHHPAAFRIAVAGVRCAQNL